MINDFFEWYSSHKRESNNRTAKEFLKKVNTNFEKNSSEQDYIDSLTKFAYDQVLNEIKKIEEVELFYCDENTKECTILESDFFVATPTSCNCKL